MNNSYRTYEIDTGNFSYEPINNFNNNYYYTFNNDKYITENNNLFNTNLSNYFNSLKNKNKKDYKNDYYNLYNSNNNYYYNTLNNFTKDHINFNNNSNKKIILTYEYKNISPLEISNKTKEIINLQSKMCSLDNSEIFNKGRAKSVIMPKIKNKNNKNNKNNDFNFQSQKNFLYNKNINPFYDTTIKNKKKNSIKKNRTFNHSMSNKKLFKNTFNNTISSFDNLEKKRNNMWKNKYLKVNEEIKNIKNKIKEVQDNNNILVKRLNYVKKKEENKNSIYEKNNKIKKYDIQLLEKYQISEMIRQKQVDLIIKMQKEVNNMREKLQMLEQ